MDSDRLLSRNFLEAHPEDGARILEGRSNEEVISVLTEFPTSIASSVLCRMDLSKSSACLEHLDEKRAGELLEPLRINEIGTLLRRLSELRRKAVLEFLPKRVALPLRLSLEFGPGTAGALMDTEALTLMEDASIVEALRRVKEYRDHVHSYLYVLNRERKLVGVVGCRDLMFSSQDGDVSNLMQPVIAQIRAEAGRAAILSHPGWGRFHALPVIDRNDKFLGVIHYQALRRLAENSSSSKSEGLLGPFLLMSEVYWTGFATLLSSLQNIVHKRGKNQIEGGG